MKGLAAALLQTTLIRPSTGLIIPWSLVRIQPGPSRRSSRMSLVSRRCEERRLALEQPREVLERQLVQLDACHQPFAHQVLELRGVQVFQVFLVHPVHAGEVHRAAALVLAERRLHGEGLEQRVVAENGAHLAAALEVGLVFREQPLDLAPFRARLALRIEHRLALLVDECLLDADQPVLLLHLVERHLRHAERVAARIGRDVNAARPGSVGDEQIFACRDPEHGDRREALALVAAGEDDRILARRELELRVADGDGVSLSAGRRLR